MTWFPRVGGTFAKWWVSAPDRGDLSQLPLLRKDGVDLQRGLEADGLPCASNHFGTSVDGTMRSGQRVAGPSTEPRLLNRSQLIRNTERTRLIQQNIHRSTGEPISAL
jgi:hypothetical protein